MATNAENSRSHAYIVALAEKYPQTFSLNPMNVRPINSDIVAEIMADNPSYKDELVHIERAIRYYKHWPSYLEAIALGKRKRNLAGQRSEKTTQEERLSARKKLEQLGRWNDGLETLFQKRIKI